MEKRTQFTFYESFRSSAKLIKKAADRALAYDILCDYALYGIEPDLEKVPESVSILFISAKPNLDASRKKAGAGSKGGKGKQTASKPQANRKREEPVTEKENEIEKEKENENEIETEWYKARCSAFDLFWNSYPISRGGSEEAKEVFLSLPDEDIPLIMPALEAFKSCAEWRKSDGQYIPGAAKFLQEQRYLKPPSLTAEVPKGASGNLGQAELEAIQRVLMEE